MAKHDGEFRAAGEVTGKLEDLLGGLGQAPGTVAARADAMAHFLSGDVGWRDARKSLRGTFAKPSPGTTGLSKGSDK